MDVQDYKDRDLFIFQTLELAQEIFVDQVKVEDGPTERVFCLSPENCIRMAEIWCEARHAYVRKNAVEQALAKTNEQQKETLQVLADSDA